MGPQVPILGPQPGSRARAQIYILGPNLGPNLIGGGPGALIYLFWAPLGPPIIYLWAPKGPCGPLGALWAVRGPYGALRGATWAPELLELNHAQAWRRGASSRGPQPLPVLGQLPLWLAIQLQCIGALRALRAHKGLQGWPILNKMGTNFK